MGMLDHWQPVAQARRLRRKPLGVVVAEQPIVVFRTQSGALGAMADMCPHRRLKLSAGTVIGERLQCKYHGWSYDACGNGESPATPKMTTCTTSFDVREEHGLIWVKSRGSNADFPLVEADGYFSLGTFEHDVPAPLELAVDNFNEIEHSGTVHSTFGYDLDRMHEVKVRIDATDDAVHVTNVGPTKRINWWYALWLGIRRGDLFHDHWTTRFSPVHSVFDHWWTDPEGTRERMIRWRVFVFYVPQDAMRTKLFSVAFARSRYPGPNGGLNLVKWLFRWELDKELRADASMLNHMADYDTGIDGLKLSRFDKVLGLNRERIDRIYRGQRTGRIALA